MLAPAIRRPALLECLDVRSSPRDPSGPQGLHHRREVRLSQQRLINWYQNRSLVVVSPRYGPCLISSSTRSSTTRNPCPPLTAITMSPAASSRVPTSRRSSE